MPLTIQRALWVTESPTAFGVYTPRSDNIFDANAPMQIYAEPMGFGWRKSGDLWHAELGADLVLRKQDGAELYRQRDFQKVGVDSWVRNREFIMTFTYIFRNVPKGEYLVDTILRDAVKGKAVTSRCPLWFAEAPSSAGGGCRWQPLTDGTGRTRVRPVSLGSYQVAK